MPVRTVDIGGHAWEVSPVRPRHAERSRRVRARSSRAVTSTPHEMRVTRYSPHGARWREQSLAELGDDDLARLFAQSQPSSMSPERGLPRVSDAGGNPGAPRRATWISTCTRPRPTARVAPAEVVARRAACGA